MLMTKLAAANQQYLQIPAASVCISQVSPEIVVTSTLPALSSVVVLMKPCIVGPGRTGGPLLCDRLFGGGIPSQRRLQVEMPQNDGSSDWEDASELPSDGGSLKLKGEGPGP